MALKIRCSAGGSQGRPGNEKRGRSPAALSTLKEVQAAAGALSVPTLDDGPLGGLLEDGVQSLGARGGLEAFAEGQQLLRWWWLRLQVHQQPVQSQWAVLMAAQPCRCSLQLLPRGQEHMQLLLAPQRCR
jgi:hypothetical protein